MPTSESLPLTSVIVVTHNSERWIRACLTALQAQDYGSGYEVLVVDNASTDSTRRIVRDEFPDVVLMAARNHGFGAGNNLGAGLARGKILAFVNPDTVAEASWLRELTVPLAVPKTITTSQVLLLHEPQKINMCGLDVHVTGLSFARLYRQDAIQGPPGPVPAFAGEAFAMWANDFHSLSGFDEDYFLYGEDADFSWRARTAGFEILCVPASRIAHDYRPTITAEKLQHLERSRTLFVRKHLSWFQRILYAPALFTCYLLVAIFARGLGWRGAAAVRRARLDARPSRLGPRAALSRFARRTVPFARVFPDRALARWLGFLPNLVFALNAAWWLRARRRWLDGTR